MHVAISINHAAHQLEHADAIRAGIERHGETVEYIGTDDVCEAADVHISWSIKRPNIFAWRARTGRNILVMERGHIGNRMLYTSCGWNGLGRRGTFPKAQDGGERFRKFFGDLLHPWKQTGTYALVIGQVEGDSALVGLSGGFRAWAKEVADRLRRDGWAVVFRPHPISERRGGLYAIDGARQSIGRMLEEDFADAKFCVTYNSTAGVGAVLSGVPTLTFDEGAMAWDVAGHIFDAIIRPDRTVWANDLAWTQWTREELMSGLAWEYLAPFALKENVQCAS